MIPRASTAMATSVAQSPGGTETGASRTIPAGQPHAADFRVCVVCVSLPPDYGGAEIAAYRYAARLARNGGRPILLAPVYGKQERRSELLPFVHPVLLDPRQGAGLPIVTGLRRLGGIAGRLWPEMYRLRHQYQVLHIFNSSPVFNLMTVPAARTLARPVVLEMSLLGSDDPLTLRRRPKRGRWWLPRPRLRYHLYRGADAYVSKSAPLTRAYHECGLPPEKLHEIPYGVDTERFRPAAPTERSALRTRLGLPDDEPLILFVGGMNPRKGVDVLLRAFRRMRARGTGATLVLVGPADKYDPAYVNGLHRYVEERQLGDRVAFVDGVLENVEDYMRACDLFVLPSSREGLPIALLEAMSCGLAVVASDIPEISRSQIRSGEQGELVPVGDVASLAERMDHLIQDARRRERLGSAARRKIKDKFSVEVVDRQYGSLYTRLLSFPQGGLSCR